MATSDLRKKLVGLITLRLVVSTTLLGWGMLMQIRSPRVEVGYFYLLIALAYAVSFVSSLTIRLVERHRWLLDAQLGCDTLIVSLFIGFTGGINSYFSSLYFLPIIAAGTLQYRRSGLLVALLGALTFIGITVLQYQGGSVVPVWLSSTVWPLPAVRIAFYTLTVNVFAFFAVAYLAGSLSEGMRVARVGLERASTEIANLQALNEHVINSLTSGLVTTDYDGRVLTFNSAAEQITGCHGPATIGRNATEVLQLPEGFLASLEADLDRSRTRRADYTFRTSDSGTIDMGLSATHLVTPGGRAGFLFNFQDVTNLKRLQRESGMQNRLAAVGEMAAGIAHEIRNPLASISGSIQVLRQEIAVNEDQGQLMDIVIRESERLNGIIRGFLAYARPHRFAIARLDLVRILNDAAVLLRNSSDAKGHAIAVDAPEGEVWYDADEGQIRQIVWNLATNGLRAMPEGGRLRLAVSRRTDRGAIPGMSEGDVLLTIEDQGVGMPADELDNIFQPFSGRFAKGSGLGLAIVHRIVSDYNGEIRVTSKPGAGTTVKVLLPARAIPAAV